MALASSAQFMDLSSFQRDVLRKPNARFYRRLGPSGDKIMRNGFIAGVARLIKRKARDRTPSSVAESHVPGRVWRAAEIEMLTVGGFAAMPLKMNRPVESPALRRRTPCAGNRG